MSDVVFYTCRRVYVPSSLVRKNRSFPARCTIRSRTPTPEAGAGTATRQLLDRGPKPLVALEPDSCRATFLRQTVWDEALMVVTSSFEDAALDEASYVNYLNMNIFIGREAVLDELGRNARDEFRGRVTRNMSTSLYIARRRPS